MALSLGRPTVVSVAHTLGAVAPLLLAIACSAPPGTEDDGDTVPPFGSGPAASTNGLQPTTNGAAGSGAVSTSGAGGTTGTEAPSSNVGLSPTPMGGGAQNTNMGQQMGAAGAPSTGAAGASGGSAGAGSGSAGTSGGVPTGAAGSSAMPPAPPPANPPPANPPPVTPPAAGNANCPGQFLCENFEAAAVGVSSPNAATWKVMANYSPVTQDAAVQVSTAQAHTGTKSLHVTASSGRSGIIATLPQNRYFLRAWLRLEAVPLGPVFIGLGTDQNSEMRLRIQGQSFAVMNIVGGGQDGVVPNAATSGNCPSCTTLTPNRWFCAEFSIDNAARAATLWIDGIEAANIVNGQGGFAAQPAAPQLFLGSMGLQGGQAGVFIDDIAVGSTRIGCNLIP